MTKKKVKKTEKTLPAHTRVLLVLDNKEKVVKFGNFEFVLQVPPFAEEAKLPMHTFDIMRELLTKDDLRNYKIPSVQIAPSDENADDSSANNEVKQEEIIPDLTNIRHAQLVWSMLPTSQVLFFSSIATLNLAIKEILYNGQQIALQVDNDGELEEIPIDTFLDFLKYIPQVDPSMQINTLLTKLSTELDNWRNEISLSPFEVKN